MDGMRIIRLLAKRADLQLTGLEIDKELVRIAGQNLVKKGFQVTFITGDIANPPDLPQFDYVICLNNTLGYIMDQNKAIHEMKKLGKVVIISVYGEKFVDILARKYFKQLHLEVEKIEHNIFSMKDFSKVKRFTKEEVESWGGRVIETPVGYFCTLAS